MKGLTGDVGDVGICSNSPWLGCSPLFVHWMKEAQAWHLCDSCYGSSHTKDVVS